jgi:tripartite-type tricarboxylate transporter receptor subunit TctC
MEQGIDVDDSSVNFRGIMVPKGTPQERIDFLAARIPEMFEHPRVERRMEAGGSPIRIMTRAEVQEMWQKRQTYLEDLLAGL